jgi:WD and tetratricopeptide repeat-containing protein 1
MAGSDDGKFFIWDRETTNIIKVLQGDDSIVNCLQPHPTTCYLATSGIDPYVRIWSPRPEDGTENERAISDYERATLANQRRMNADPFESFLMDMGYRVRDMGGNNNDDDEHNAENDNDNGDDDGPVQCRTS